MAQPNLLELLRAATAQAEMQARPGLAKCSRVDSLRAEGHLEFRRACDQLEEHGMCHSDVARYFDVSRQTVSDWYHYGSHQRKQLPDYATRGVEKLLIAARCGMVASG